MGSILRKGLFLVTVSGALAAFPMTVEASVLEEDFSVKSIMEDKRKMVPENKGEYSDMAFANVETFLYIRSEPTKQSEWVGKLYPDDAVNIIGPVEEWTKVTSGSVTGYVCSKYITVGEKANEKAHDIIEEKKQVKVKSVEKESMEVKAVEMKSLENSFSYAESREQEAKRLEREVQEAKKRAEEEARRKSEKGKEIVDFACQFIGNPYVWGGTSLTNGADCSGFVQSVFSHFGVQLPRTSGEMRGVGTEVSYENAIPGDIICYDGHVGIYMGNGEIVNAIGSEWGIGISSATYSNILTVRRLI